MFFVEREEKNVMMSHKNKTYKVCIKSWTSFVFALQSQKNGNSERKIVFHWFIYTLKISFYVHAHTYTHTHFHQ